MKLAAPIRALCCYPAADGFIAALAARIEAALAAWPRDVKLRILLSAHGLPERIVAKGDPYRWQVETTATALAARIGGRHETIVCYQSRVGPLAWLKPATDAEIRRAGADHVGLIVAPIAFVSEHSETLVELDLDYGKLARDAGVPRYVRVPTVSDDATFIATLADLVRAARTHGRIAPAAGARFCPQDFALCPCQGGVP